MNWKKVLLLLILVFITLGPIGLSLIPGVIFGPKIGFIGMICWLCLSAFVIGLGVVFSSGYK